MSTIGKLLGRSPFGPLQQHMEQVAECVGKMEEALTALEEGRWGDIASIADATSQLEHAADQLKDDIRNQMLRRFFIPVDRAQILTILGIQDNLADAAEDVTVLLTFRKLTIPAALLEDFRSFRELNCKAFSLVREIIQQLDELFESGFGGAEAEKIRQMVRDVAYTEHQADVVQRSLMRKVLGEELSLTAAELNMWMQLIKEISGLSNMSENLADRIRMTLDTK